MGKVKLQEYESILVFCNCTAKTVKEILLLFFLKYSFRTLVTITVSNGVLEVTPNQSGKFLMLESLHQLEIPLPAILL